MRFRPGPQVPDSRAVPRRSADEAIHHWFLHRGLPAVLSRRVRSRNLPERAAPAIAVAGAALALHDIAVESTAGAHDAAVVARLCAVAVLLLATAGAVVAARRRQVKRAAAWIGLTVFVLGMPVAQYAWGRWALEAVLIIVTAALMTQLGIGSIALWALRFAWMQFGALGTLMSRALPLLMLTVLAYFTNEIWQLCARLSGRRFGQVIAFLALVAVAFMVTTIRDEVRELRTGRFADHDAVAMLAGTPLQTPLTPARRELSTAERLNVVAVMVLAQAIQVVFFAAGVFVFFMTLGIIAVPDDLQLLWSGEQSCAVGEPPCQAVVLGVPLPVSQTAVLTALFVAVLSGLYFTVSSSVDPMYRQRFFEPLIADVAVSLAGRDAYLQMHTFRGEPMADADVFGKRYGEVLLVRMTETGPEASVYNSFPLNDCPAELWDKLEADAIAKDNGAIAALLNGPRYWLMSGIEKDTSAPQKTMSFGGIDMIQQAVVQLSSMNPAPYSVNKVDRRAIFTFNAGRPVFELVDPDGQRWVMQTWSQTVDKNLSLDDLPGLASRLTLPDGWSYQTRTLSAPLRLDTTNRDAHVTQDDLANSYSLQFQ